MSSPITFSSLFHITPSTSHTYTLHLSDVFCVGSVPNGGYVTSAFLVCAKTHMQTTHPKISCPNPINLHLEFLRRTAAGPATFHVRDVKLGRRISNLHLTLRQRQNPFDESSEWQDEVEGYLTMTNLATEDGISHATGYKLLPPPLPVDLNALDKNEDVNYIKRRRDPYGSFTRVTLHMDMHLVRPEKRRKDATFAISDQWVRFRPLDPDMPEKEFLSRLKRGELVRREGRWTNDALGYLVDVFPQLNEFYLNREIEDAVLTSPDIISDEEIIKMARSGKNLQQDAQNEGAPRRAFWYPTLLLNLDVKKLLPEEGVEWIFVRIQTKKVERGRFDLNIEVRDEGGDLVALSSHAVLAVSASRNLKRKENGKKDSKI